MRAAVALTWPQRHHFVYFKHGGYCHIGVKALMSLGRKPNSSMIQETVPKVPEHGIG